MFSAQPARTLSVESVVVMPMVTFAVMFFVYGECASFGLRSAKLIKRKRILRVLLFGICIFTIRRRMCPSSNVKRLYLIWTVALFIISTATVAAVTTVHTQVAAAGFRLILQDGNPGPPSMKDPMERIVIAAEILTIVANAIADSMLIHRCHIVWGSRTQITYPLIASSIMSTAANLAGEILACNERLSNGHFVRGLRLAGEVAFAAVNLVLTLLTAGRVWWVIRQAQAHLGKQTVRTKYRALVSINRAILESRMIYPILITIHLGTCTPDLQNNTHINLLPVVSLAAGIAPTLIIVRANLGKNIVDEMTQAGESFTTFQPMYVSSFVSCVENPLVNGGNDGEGEERETTAP